MGGGGTEERRESLDGDSRGQILTPVLETGLRGYRGHSLSLLVIKDRRRQEGLRGRNQLSPEVWSPHLEGRREVPGHGTLAGPHSLLTLLRCLLREADDRTIEDIHWQLSYGDYTGTGRDAWRRGSVSLHGPCSHRGGRRREGLGREGGCALPVLAENQSASAAGSPVRLSRRPHDLERIPSLAW